MSLSPEAAAFLGRPPAKIARGRSVRLLTGGELEDELLADIPTTVSIGADPRAALPTPGIQREDTMPKTSTTEAPRQKRKYTRRKPLLPRGADSTLRDAANAGAVSITLEKKRSAAGVIFSIDSTGALLIRRGDYGMEFSAAEVDAMMAFLEKSRILWGPE